MYCRGWISKWIYDEIRRELKEYNEKNKIYDDVDVLKEKQYNAIFLAGSTGYLGIHILYELINNTNSMIYLLVRGNSVKDAKKRIEEKVNHYFDSKKIIGEIKERVIILNGDLTEERFGLSKEMYNSLSNKVDCIINAAANVRHYVKYED